MKTIYIIIFIPMLIIISGCKGEATIQGKISESFSGSAFDAITDTVERYGGINKATDGLSEAQSFGFDINTGELSCMVHVECRDPSSNDLVNDQANVTSNNQVNRAFKITKKGDLTFDIKIKVEGEEIIHGDSITINIQANILNRDGSGNRNGGMINGDLVIKPSPNGTDNLHAKIYSNQDNRYLNPETKAVDQNGDVEHNIQITVKENDNLSPGDYQLELSLRVAAYARTEVGSDGKRFKALVEKVIATITLN